jgi:hypothetical protein
MRDNHRNELIVVVFFMRFRSLIDHALFAVALALKGALHRY